MGLSAVKLETKPMSLRDAMKQLAKVIMDIDVAFATEDQKMREELQSVKNRVAELYAKSEEKTV